MELAIFLIVAALVVLVLAVITQGAEINDLVKKISTEFPGAKLYISPSDSSYLAVDFSSERIILGLEKQRGTKWAEEPKY